MNEEPIKKLVLLNKEWKKRLTPEQYAVLREKHTEPAFKGALVDNHEDGHYTCAACHLSLFSSKTKFDSGSGWPSFWEPIDPSRIQLEDDYHLLYKRVEVLCARCESHLGHVFEDGPPPTGKRYCINSIALLFVPSKESIQNEKE